MKKDEVSLYINMPQNNGSIIINAIKKNANGMHNNLRDESSSISKFAKKIASLRDKEIEIKAFPGGGIEISLKNEKDFNIIDIIVRNNCSENLIIEKGELGNVYYINFNNLQEYDKWVSDFEKNNFKDMSSEEVNMLL